MVAIYNWENILKLPKSYAILTNFDHHRVSNNNLPVKVYYYIIGNNKLHRNQTFFTIELCRNSLEEHFYLHLFLVSEFFARILDRTRSRFFEN